MDFLNSYFSPFTPYGLNSLDRSFSYTRGVWFVILCLPCFIEKIPLICANSVDPDQTPYYGASDLGLFVCQCPFLGALAIKGLGL